jgi:4-carboxymuconolactone decarboxylase
MRAFGIGAMKNANTMCGVGQVVIPLPADRELSEATVVILASHPPINVLRMFGLTEDMLPGVLAMVGAVFNAEGVDAKLREVIILRCAHLLNVPYELQANTVMAANAGLTPGQIAAICKDGPVQGLDPEATLICQATEELTERATLADETLAKLIDRYGKSLAAKLILSIGWFNMLNRFLNGTRVPLETSNKYAGRTSPI